MTTTYSEKYNLKEESDPMAWDYYKRQLAQRWDSEEICLADDLNVWNQQPLRIKELVKDLVAFFAPGDGLVCEQVDHIKAETADFCQRAFLGEQYSIEVVHARAYKDIIMTFFDQKTQQEIFESVDTLPCVREKAEFITKYMMNKDLPLSLRYIAAAVSEGVFFVSLFAVIFYIRGKKILKQFCFLNEQVAKDEKLHRDFDLEMAKRGFQNKEFTVEQAVEIVRYGMWVEMEHIAYILREPVDSKETDELGGMTLENMNGFIANLADQILQGVGISRHFSYNSSESPVKGRFKAFSPHWMKDMSASRKTNFYEGKVGNYMLVSERKDSPEESKKAFTNPEDLDI